MITTDPRQCSLCRIAYDSEGNPLPNIQAQHRVINPVSGERQCVLSLGRTPNLPMHQMAEARAAA